MALRGSLPQINFGVQGETQVGHHKPTAAQENQRPCSEKTKVYIEESARVIKSELSGEIQYILEESRGSQLANMVTNDVKVAKLVANLVAQNDANLALPSNSH
ncbi:hypothetical protein TNCV_2813971 [Trichonephila clavipes]|nr:hypothetical protein TNCV_2813971 [Trichonephila clavipes]